MLKKNHYFPAKIAIGIALVSAGLICNKQTINAADTTSPNTVSIADEIAAAIPLPQPTGKEVVIPTNASLAKDTNYAKLSIANWQSMPEGTEFSWRYKPSTLFNGPAKGTVTVSLPDGTAKNVEVTVQIAGTQQVTLTSNTYLYNENGQQIDLLLKHGSVVNVIATKDINGTSFYMLDDQHYLPISNAPKTKKVTSSNTKRVMHSTYLYNSKGHRANGLILQTGSRVHIIKTTEDNNVHIAAGRNFYKIGDNLYAPVRNITGLGPNWSDKAIPVYNYHGKKTGVIKAHTPYRTYGDPIKLNGKSYDIIGKGKLIK